MKNYSNHLYALLVCLLICKSSVNAQNIGINATGASPNTSAMLDIDAGALPVKKGMLIPRVTSTERTAMNPLPAAAQGLVVYQTNATEGFYYNTSITTTPNWMYLSSGWTLSGNAGTTPATNFIGTTDANDLALRTNNIENARLTSGGNLGIGTAVPIHGKLEITGSIGAVVGMFGADRQGVAIMSDFPEIGFNYFYNGGYKTFRPGFASMIGMDTTNGEMYIRNFNNNQSVSNFGSITGMKDVLRIKQNGNIGIGTANPVRPFEIATGQLRFSNSLGDVEFTECADLCANVTTASPAPTTPVLRVASGTNVNNNLLFLQHNGNMGLGTIAPNYARIQVEGMVGNTVGYFSGSSGTNRRGVSIIADEPGIYFNCYWNGNCKAMASSGFPAVLNVDQLSGAMRFYTTTTPNSIADVNNNAFERMRIAGNGDVAIGLNPAPIAGYRLTVYGSSIASGGTWVNSDARYKKNIQPINNALESVLKLQGVTYDYKRDEFPNWNFDSINQIGVIAQEVEKILPELVKTDEAGYKAVSYEKFTPVLIEAIKEQQKAIELLKSEIEKLKIKQ